MMTNIKFKNLGSNAVDLYVYGAICDEKTPDFWTGETSTLDIDLTEFQDAINTLKQGDVLNIYVNSPGGSVFAASTMCSMLQRAKNNGVTIHAFIDGLAASAASFLVMAADDITMYQNSMLMIHKPMCMSCGNANDLRKDIEVLDQLEESVMMPLYRSKAKCTDDEIKDKINAESWLNVEKTAEMFNIIVSYEQKEVVACDRAILAKYKNCPKELIEEPKEPETTPASAEIVKAYFNSFEERIAKLRKGE